MLLDKCNEACGYAAAITAAICLGSFGVPVKSEVVRRLDVDPLVVQSYKTMMCFLTSWLILLSGEPLRFTKWGIVSGLFWVPGGWAGIYGIRTAGLAVAVGTWSSMNVLTAVVWGTFVFEEHVKSVPHACGACATLISGLIGMSIFSRPQTKIKRRRKDDIDDDTTITEDNNGKDRKRRISETSSTAVDEDDIEGNMRKRIQHSSSNDLQAPLITKQRTTGDSKASKRSGTKKNSPTPTKTKILEVKAANEKAAPSLSTSLTPLEMESLLEDKDKLKHPTKTSDKRSKSITFFNGRVTLTRRQTGILASLFNGLWGGTNMIPLHYAAHSGYGGPSYVISFAIGSLLVTIILWIIRFAFELYRHEGNISQAWASLPSFYIKHMWFQGGLSGILYSGGNFMCIIAVTYLGQGVGFSFIQASMLISGLW